MQDQRIYRRAARSTAIGLNQHMCRPIRLWKTHTWSGKDSDMSRLYLTERIAHRPPRQFGSCKEFGSSFQRIQWQRNIILNLQYVVVKVE